MPWWGWLALGAALLAAEVVAQTEFWLALVGTAALVVGLALTLGIEPEVWIQWIAFAAIAVGMNLLFRRRLSEKLVGRAPGLAPELVGETGVALEPIAPGAVGPVELRGSTWRARNVGELPLATRAPVRVTGKNGILLDVQG